MYEPDFVERNGSWILTVVGIFSSCCAASFVYLLKSRCTKIKCFCVECDRAVLAMDPADVTVSSA